jgi:site-specific DNA-methyltransferase (adenine-specific)
MVQQDLHKGFDMAIINPLLCSAAVAFASNNQLAKLLSHMAGNFDRHALCIWQKTNPQPIANKSYRTDCEFYVHAWRRDFHPVGDVSQKLRIRRVTSPRGADRHGHPTCKPLQLMDSIMLNVAGRAVCDPFMGSGTTGVAAIRAGKIFTGIEQNPDHFATAVARITAAWEAMQAEAA